MAPIRRYNKIKIRETFPFADRVTLYFSAPALNNSVTFRLLTFLFCPFIIKVLNRNLVFAAIFHE